MKIDRQFLDELTRLAKESPRLRANYDLRDSEQSDSQRMLNALEPGTLLPVHRHPSTAETVALLRGKAVQYIYDGCGRVVDSVVMEAGGDCPAMVVEPGVWHRLESLAAGTVIIESKEGPYEPLSAGDILEVPPQGA